MACSIIMTSFSNEEPWPDIFIKVFIIFFVKF